MHIENAKGKKLLTDYKDTKGTFENVTMLGVWAGVTMENGTKYDVVNLKTGEKLEDYRILVADGEQAGWLCPMDITKVTYGKDYIALADGTKSTATYDRMTNFKDGKAVVNVERQDYSCHRHHRQDPVEHEFCV